MRKIVWTLALAWLSSVANVATAQDSSKAIIEKAQQARGGAEKLAKYTGATWKGKGTFYGTGEGVPFGGDWASQAPDKANYTVNVKIMDQEIKLQVVSDGKQGWRKFNDQLLDMNEEQLAEMKQELHAQGILARLQVTGPDYQLAPLPEIKVENKPAVGVKVSRKGFRDVSLYFDKESHHLVKTELQIKDVDQGQEFKQETIVLEYKDVMGMKYPTKLRILRDGQKFVENELADVKLVEKLDDAAFKKPE